jgi:hypothetical protein
MKAYLATTCVVFGLLTVVHLWRMIAEAGGPGRDPWFLLITLTAAAFAVWAGLLLRRARQP